ncbi:hypothetical protein LWC34_00165 [Kibdelosporangium philippinense]|uniref:Uncharacterized protein n=1 Tax=Kibdelosporangium philippinense TaxID=211113 RepID=A0ABS8Z1B3_9PSEU|nr:hypothetical protein [Kibdelosporangium philippinense]MCE7001262.1 hypothetical protein [Kibdelosporangium philippinense]
MHGSWNHFVGPNAALFDDGADAELKHWNVYTIAVRRNGVTIPPTDQPPGPC